MTPRLGSRKRSVFDHLQANGASAAEAFGLTLGLRPSTVRSWIALWEKEDGIKILGRNNAAIHSHLLHQRGNDRRFVRVEVYADDKDKEVWEGVVVKQGDQQSEVRLTTGPLTGYVRVIPNGYLDEILHD